MCYDFFVLIVHYTEVHILYNTLVRLFSIQMYKTPCETIQAVFIRNDIHTYIMIFIDIALSDAFLFWLLIR
jgi:hypothetical protein